MFSLSCKLEVPIDGVRCNPLGVSLQPLCLILGGWPEIGDPPFSKLRLWETAPH